MSKLLNTKTAAEKLGVSVRRIQFLITNGQLTAEKFGRDYMIRESDLPKLEKRKRGRRVGSKTKKPTVPDMQAVPDAPETVKPPTVPETVKTDAPTVPDVPDAVAPEPKTLLSKESAAAELNCSVKEIEKMKRNGLPTEKGKIIQKTLRAFYKKWKK